MSHTENIERIKNALQGMIDSADSTIEQFKAYLDKDPAHAMEWGSRAVESAARKSEASMILGAIERQDSNIDFIVEWVEDHQTSLSLYPKFSTSPMANLMHVYRTQAVTEIKKLLKSFAKRA